ncbi:MAG: flavodoxin-dependent (E)-4-hydroxy-3-methylbut-2-enyl-diphosphate synthase, partial [Pyramidobacter sp.]|nr:flavodoxin-dependent (E)-4-hydroxy-3-methylbut-2-enyl-diphosphate synthase [Pyramidobacter sp.]
MKKTLRIGSLTIGAGAPLRVESMLKTRLHDTEACLAQLAELKNEGCELVRVALPNAGLKD